ncbi:MAG: hypothetical protein A2Y75_11590 [Candidatus Solincola sediminis]|uniref:Uncharacterized protein n=1 Tax=Candidatus Solincola sediminis TaxID=1797199 RepID=A0A1F2WRM0_9ACTN|nr:MAG: hypothetical protein A2Y75_11590 [Candidatus Solincola sediminis]
MIKERGGVEVGTRIALIFVAVTLAIAAIAGGFALSTTAAGVTYPEHKNISTTLFWVGEAAGPENGYISNSQSAWDEQWQQHYGGVDDPNHRNGYHPAAFTPKENPFYFALPYNDFDGNGNRKSDVSMVYWWGSKQWGRDESCCKDQWIKITKGSKTAYAQWEDCGPYGEDDVNYVFGSSSSADSVGFDVSPAVNDYLGLADTDTVNWQFVDAASVPSGPWTEIITGDVTIPKEATISSYFAEGYTGEGFEEWLCLMNPNATATTAYITYIFKDAAPWNRSLLIGGTSRATINVNDVVGSGKEVSIKVSSELPLVAERPMYFNYKGKWSGGHAVVGVPSTSSTCYFAEGYTGAGFEEWLSIMNLETASTAAHITFMFTDGTTKTQDLTIGGTTRATLNVNDAVGVDKNVSIAITSDAPIVAERPIYFNYKGAWTGGHDVVGCSK